jgi:hypothetical protein
VSKLNWDQDGDRIFEMGIDRGVLFIGSQPGVPWNGLVSVSEKPVTTSPVAYYIDGIKYYNSLPSKEYAGSLQAFTYPDEFLECEGFAEAHQGFILDEQPSRPFDLAYRTLVGNDLKGQAFGYKLHFIYNALATPSEFTYQTIGDTNNPEPFSWDLTTTPIRGLSTSDLSFQPVSHFIIDSTKQRRALMRLIEAYLYGSETNDSHIPSFVQFDTWFKNPPLDILKIYANRSTGLYDLVEEDAGDLIGFIENGLYDQTENTRLILSNRDGYYVLPPIEIDKLAVDYQPETGLNPLELAIFGDVVVSTIDDDYYEISEGSRLVESQYEGLYTINRTISSRLQISPTSSPGINLLLPSARGDFISETSEMGIYSATDNTRLRKTSVDGIYTLNPLG